MIQLQGLILALLKDLPKSIHQEYTITYLQIITIRYPSSANRFIQ